VVTTYTNIQDIVGGGSHTCARSMANGITCSGYNGHGQLGDGRRTTQGTPHPVTGLTGVTAIAAGDAFTCATLTDKTVACWGQNGLGQLGDGSFTGRTKPTPVQGVQGAAAIAVGGDHACVLLDDPTHTVKCWGGNSRGQLGDNTTDSHGVPRPVVVDMTGAKLTDVTQIAAGGAHTCALVTGGAVRCWGAGDGGQNGDGTLGDTHVPSTAVALPAGVLQVAVGDGHACALNADHSVSCWGFNYSGQLGNGGGPGSSTPVATGLKSIEEVTAHGRFTCARATDASIWCWGSGGNGELGIGEYNGRDVPVKTKGAADATKVVSGGGHTCAITTGKTIKCWGQSYVGQVGDDGYGARLEPVQIAGLANVIDLAAGDQHTCALLQDATVSCWGDDRDGELGDGISRERGPVAPLLPCP
jgi:alpha-tubulin suppressor-like RCC1 family protein